MSELRNLKKKSELNLEISKEKFINQIMSETGADVNKIKIIIKTWFIILIFMGNVLFCSCNNTDYSKQLVGVWVTIDDFIGDVIIIEDSTMRNIHSLPCKISISKQYISIVSGYIDLFLDGKFYNENDKIYYQMLKDTLKLKIKNDYEREVNFVRIDNSNIEHLAFAGQFVTGFLPQINNNIKTSYLSLLKTYNFIYIGKPKKILQLKYGTEPRIQSNTAFVDSGNMSDFFKGIENSIEIIYICADKEIKMGIMNDIIDGWGQSRVQLVLLGVDDVGNLGTFSLSNLNYINHDDAYDDKSEKIRITQFDRCSFEGRSIAEDNILNYFTEHFKDRLTRSVVELQYDRRTSLEAFLLVVNTLQKIIQEKQKSNPDFFIDINIRYFSYYSDDKR